MLADTNDLIAIGALPSGADDKLQARAARLLELVNAQVCVHLGADETALTVGPTALSQDQLKSLAAVIAVVAATALGRPGAGNVDYVPGVGFDAVLLSDDIKQTISNIAGQTLIA